MQWEKVTDIILITSLAVLAVFACLGLYQWITRKSLKKVDRTLLAFIPTMLLLVAIYIIFDKFIILSTRPDGSGKPSFPSSHTMAVATIFFCTMLALPRYVKKRSLRVLLDVVMAILISLTATGRVLSNKHWPTDVICGLVFAIVLSGIYGLISHKRSKKHAQHLHKDSE
ncbi:phosphatase PAP2 family protein [Candidatus Saccharibacteria bacterium]|nr:phosphatase PAP2 family protein [Candidatus Saccharibacteria bacterium]